jgi:hypothetical protein
MLGPPTASYCCWWRAGEVKTAVNVWGLGSHFVIEGVFFSIENCQCKKQMKKMDAGTISPPACDSYSDCYCRSGEGLGGSSRLCVWAGMLSLAWRGCTSSLKKEISSCCKNTWKNWMQAQSDLLLMASAGFFCWSGVVVHTHSTLCLGAGMVLLAWRGSLTEKNDQWALAKYKCQKWEAGSSSLVAPADCCCWYGLGVDGGSREYLGAWALDFDGA